MSFSSWGPARKGPYNIGASKIRTVSGMFYIGSTILRVSNCYDPETRVQGMSD